MAELELEVGVVVTKAFAAFVLDYNVRGSITIARVLDTILR